MIQLPDHNGNQDSSPEPTNPVPTAEDQCHQEGTANGSIAPMSVEPKPTKSENRRRKRKPLLTFASSERQRCCEQCGAKMVIKRPKNFKPKRFCSNQCKRRYHYLKTGQ